MSEIITKLYIEPTTFCNLNCEMCSRKYWIDESFGHMSKENFARVIDQVRQIESIETVFFGGIGEPLFHPDIIDMIKSVKATGKRAELITNGTLLSKEMIDDIIDAQLDQIWVSVDGIDVATYEDIRKGADHNTVIGGLTRLREQRIERGSRMDVGLAFVLMKKNVDQISKFPDFARKYHARDVKVTNLIPYSRDMVGEILYERSISTGLSSEEFNLNIDLPIFDVVEEVKEPMYKLLRSMANFSIFGTPINREANYCSFVQEGKTCVRWDGELCPCIALLHSSKLFLYEWERHTRYASFGNVGESTIKEIWESEEYVAFRDRVMRFDFPACTVCGACDMLESNETDCYNNPFPACGGCLWAQGFIQCP